MSLITSKKLGKYKNFHMFTYLKQLTKTFVYPGFIIHQSQNIMKKAKLLILIMLAASAVKAQNIVLEFHANHSCAQVGLDSLWIENLTQGGMMVLYYPDNIAVFTVTDIGDFDPGHNQLHVSQNYPNPFSALTYIDVYLATPDVVSLNVYDLTGRTVVRHEDILEEGMHRFSFSAGVEKTYILTVTSNKHVEKRIMLQMGVASSAVSEISYLGASVDDAPKAAPKSSDFNFSPGDDLMFTGYVTDFVENMDYGVINDAPETSTEYLFDIANTPPDQPSEISGEDYVPVNATGLVYGVEEIQGLTYLWSVPDGWEITQGQGSHAITVDAGSDSGDVSVKAQNNCGMSEASVLSVDVYEPEPGTVTDIDGNVYQTVIIGDQEWMAENLRVTRYNNEDDIPTGLSDTEWENATDGAYTLYPHDGGYTEDDVEGINSDEEMVEAHGKLYNWYAVDDPRGLCPEGWHVPSDADWTQLVDYVVDQGYPQECDNPNGAGNALKSCRQVNSPLGRDCDTSEHPRWNANETHYGFDEFGFSAVPGGGLDTGGLYYGIGGGGYWWSSTEASSSSAWARYMGRGYGDVLRGSNGKRDGFSVRCIRDATEEPTLYHLQLEADPENAGTVNGAGEYQEGDEVNITATAEEGWEFVNWTGDTDHVDDPTSANATVTMPAENISLTANFQDKDDADIIYGDGVIDIDGNEYITVIIGNQEWMAENLRVSKYNNGDNIPTGLSDEDWEDTTDGARAIYPYWLIYGLSSEEEVVDAYGKLYNWYAVNDTRGLCPTGWSVPSDADWTQLVDYVVAHGFPNDEDNLNGAGNALKSCRQVGSPLGGDCDTSEHPRWLSPPEWADDHYGFDEFGFSALPGGYRWSYGSFDGIGTRSFWWSSFEFSSADASFRFMSKNGGFFYRYYDNKSFGVTVRCVRD